MKYLESKQNNYEANSINSKCVVIAESEEGYHFDLSISPERALSSAVLFDAMQNLFLIDKESKEGKRFVKRAFSWVYHCGEDFPFSFPQVCDALGLETLGLQLGIENSFRTGGCIH